jgi:ferric-dicitrate binding protein FerR (iron transport regulator)
MEERIHYLFKRYLDNTCSQQELEEFLAYIHKAKSDEQLRQLIKKVYTDLKVNGNATYVDEKGRLVLNDADWMNTDEPEIQVKKSKIKTLAGIAAVVVITTGIWWVSKNNIIEKKGSVSVASLTKKLTDRSESKFILLEDSSRIWLNSSSSLEFPDQFDNTKREVFLTGEAYFDVKHADKIPFIIHTGNVSTTVLGTAFNIKAYPGQKNITISVSRGKVRITRKDGWETTLTKGQQLKVNEEGTEAAEKNIPAEKIAAWQQGNIVFDDEELQDIVSDMERIYNVSINVSHPALTGLRISTSFKREIGVEQALQVLCKLTDTELKQKDGVYTIQ